VTIAAPVIHSDPDTLDGTPVSVGTRVPLCLYLPHLSNEGTVTRPIRSDRPATIIKPWIFSKSDRAAIVQLYLCMMTPADS